MFKDNTITPVKFKKIKQLRVNSCVFDVVWTDKHAGGSLSYTENKLEIGTKNGPYQAFEVIVHEITEFAAIECAARFKRPDVDEDYLFSYFHDKHTTMCAMVAGMLSQFL